MRLIIDIKMENDAFRSNLESELKAVIRTAMDNINGALSNGTPAAYGLILDTNGNRCGTFQITEK